MLELRNFPDLVCHPWAMGFGIHAKMTSLLTLPMAGNAVELTPPPTGGGWEAMLLN